MTEKKEIEVHILTGPTGTVLAISTKSICEAIKTYVKDYIPSNMLPHIQWGTSYSYGYLRECWKAMEGAGYKHTTRWIEL